LADFALGGGEVEAIAPALSAKAQLIGIDDKNGINACKLLKLPFATALNILIRMREKGLIEKEAAFIMLAHLERYGRYKSSIIADARSRLEEEQ
jgi:predicted nucleic acid-binding protein